MGEIKKQREREKEKKRGRRSEEGKKGIDRTKEKTIKCKKERNKKEGRLGSRFSHSCLQ